MNVKAPAAPLQVAGAVSLKRQGATDVVRVGQFPAATFGLDKVFSDPALAQGPHRGRPPYADGTKNTWGAVRAPMGHRLQHQAIGVRDV